MNLTNSRLTEQQLQALCAKRPVRVVENGDIMTGPVRLSFPSLANKAKAVQAGGKEKYQAALLFPHKNMAPLMDALRAKLREFYPNVPDPSVFIDPFNKDHPVRDQGQKVSVAEGGRNVVGKTLGGYVPGFAFINPKSMRAPPCFHVVRGQWVPVLPEEIEKVFYGGCWVDAKIVVIKSTTAANPGAALGLQGLWKLADDNGFGGGGGASADEGGDTGDAFAAEDPNSIMTPNDTASSNDWG